MKYLLTIVILVLASTVLPLLYFRPENKPVPENQASCPTAPPYLPCKNKLTLEIFMLNS